MDNFLIGVLFAVFDDLVHENAARLKIGKVLVSEAIVQAAVPRRECVGVFLVHVEELAAGQRLHVDEAVASA